MTLDTVVGRSSGPYSCSACGHGSPRWFGRCPGCGAWSSAGDGDDPGEAVVTTLAAGAIQAERAATGLPEADAVLGGGLVRGSAVLLAGEPGIGKSTLVLQLLDGAARRGLRAMVATGEESVDQLGLRAARLGIHTEGLLATATPVAHEIIAAARRERPDVLVVDSIQTLADARVDGAPGSLNQVRECAGSMVRYAKETGAVVVMVGHVTKEGSVAGPKALEHVVDVVLTMDGERSGGLRLLRALKNRFGPCDQTGVFEMGGRGLVAVGDPSAMLLSGRRPGVPGSVVFAGLEGARPVLVEVQALVSRSPLAQPRRTAIGLDSRRLLVLAGVMLKRAQLQIDGQDVFVAAAGGLMVREPAADLAVCIAVASAFREVPTNADVVAIGEVGLSGELRRVPALERRLHEAARLGFTTAVVPDGKERIPPAVRALRVSDLTEALNVVASVTNATS